MTPYTYLCLVFVNFSQGGSWGKGIIKKKNQRIAPASVLVSCGCHTRVLQTQWLKRTEIYCLTFPEGRSSKSSCQQSHVPSETCRGESLFAFSSFWYLLVILGIPCLVRASLQYMTPSSHGRFLPVCLCLCIF